MKSVRLSGLAASTALALILALSSQPGQAQSSSDGQAQVAAPAADSGMKPEAAGKPMDKPAEAAKDVPEQAAQALPKVSVPLPDVAAPTEKEVHIQPAEDAPTKAASIPHVTGALPGADNKTVTQARRHETDRGAEAGRRHPGGNAAGALRTPPSPTRSRT